MIYMLLKNTLSDDDRKIERLSVIIFCGMFILWGLCHEDLTALGCIMKLFPFFKLVFFWNVADML